MGQHLSTAKKSRRNTHKFFHSQIFMNGNNNLSHTFAVFDNEPVTDLVNVNTASENELLKVHDIDSELSRNIIKHRKAIGYFQKVEDLVVVPGMGAEKSNRIWHSVCVNTKNITRNSLQSFDSLKSVDSRLTVTKSKMLVNINVASIFELQLVHGITQEIAAAIVCYRSKRGPFKRVEDLMKIKCIDCIRSDNISRYLTVLNDADISETESGQSYSLTSNGSCRTNDDLYFSCRNGTTNGLLASTVADIFELLSAYSPRPIVKELFRYSRNDRSAFRVSSWNLDWFSIDKASNLGVKEVICRTILENGWSIVAVQNVRDKDSLKIICDESNEPKLLRVGEWKFNRNCWKYNTIENSKLGFIYDCKGVDEITMTMSEEGPSKLNQTCDSSITVFKIGNTKVQILNLKINDDSNGDVQDYLEKFMNIETECLICGDFGSFPSYTKFLMNSENSKLILPTNISNSYHLTTNSAKYCSSNFVVNNKLEKYSTGLQGVQRNGLTHSAIPSGWSWGGPVSQSCPIWIEFFVNPN